METPSKPRLSKEAVLRLAHACRMVCVPRVVCTHLIGKEHTMRHRMWTGFVIMLFGVIVAKSGMFLAFFILHVLADLVGFLIHAIGAIPFVEWLLSKVAEQMETE